MAAEMVIAMLILPHGLGYGLPHVLSTPIESPLWPLGLQGEFIIYLLLKSRIYQNPVVNFFIYLFFTTQLYLQLQLLHYLQY